MNNFLIKNKHKILILVSIIVFSFWAVPTYASTFLTNSSSMNVKKGDVVKVVVSVDPQNLTNYTLKLSLNFSEDVLEVEDWQWAPSWMPINVAEYNSTNNYLGHMIKTAGYPGGVINQKEFGTITFIAKKDGYGTVSFGNDSFILNADGYNIYNK